MLRILTLIVTLAALGAAGSSVAQAAPQATPVPGLSAPGEAIAVGADGAMWLAEPADPGAIARVTMAGAVTEYTGGVTPNFVADERPRGLTVLPDGRAWFLLSGSAEVGRITTSGVYGRHAHSTGTPTSMTGGPDGGLWMTVDSDSGADGICRYDTGTTDLRCYTAGLASGSSPRSIVTGPDGALWFVEGGGAGRVGRITTDGVMDFRSVGAAPDLLGTGVGALWLASGTAVAPLTTFASSPFTAVSSATAMAPGPDGAMWIAGTGGVTRILADGATAEVTAGLAGNARGMGIAAGPDGRMWMTLDRAPYLARITVPPGVQAPVTAATGATSATVGATVRPNGLDTTMTVEVRAADGSWSPAGQTDAGAGTAATPVTLAVSSLASSATTTFRVTAANAAGATTSAPVTVDTPAPPATPGTTAAAESAAPPRAVPVPTRGRSVVVAAERGTVRVKAPGALGYTTLGADASLPVGALVDTTRGTVTLSSAVRGGNQTGRFWGGVFRVKQATAGHGRTRIVLAGVLGCGNRTVAQGIGPVAAPAAKKRRKARRQVWGEDDHGDFATQGHNSVAVVRGTRWLVRDTCAGTLVRVRRGAVLVRDRGPWAGKPVLLHAGDEHLTRRR